MNENQQEVTPETQEKIEVDKTEFEKLKETVATIPGVVEELKTLRTAKQESDARADAAEAALKAKEEGGNPNPPAPTDPAALVAAEFRKRDEDERKRLRDNAVEAFKNVHKEFHPENDPGGLKYAAFERHLNRLNLSDAASAKDFADAFEDAYLLMTRKPVQQEDNTPIVDGDPNNSGGAPHTPPQQTGLTAKEKKVIADMGWTEERYLKLKKSRPAYVDSLLNYVK